METLNSTDALARAAQNLQNAAQDFLAYGHGREGKLDVEQLRWLAGALHSCHEGLASVENLSRLG